MTEGKQARYSDDVCNPSTWAVEAGGQSAEDKEGQMLDKGKEMKQL